MRDDDRADDHARDTPPAVIAAVAAGTGALPFLAVYAAIFIIHGGFHHVVPPDVTDSNRGELIAGLVCLAAFVVTLTTLVWLLNAHRRWPFAVVQAALLAASVDLLIDPTSGGRVVSGLVAVTSLVALVLCAHPQMWDHLGRPRPRWTAGLSARRQPALVGRGEDD